MSQHYTSNTVSAAAWCKTCNKETQHHVSAHKLAHCLPCAERRQQPKPPDQAKTPQAPQPRLFD